VVGGGHGVVVTSGYRLFAEKRLAEEYFEWDRMTSVLLEALTLALQRSVHCDL